MEKPIKRSSFEALAYSEEINIEKWESCSGYIMIGANNLCE
jgi:hypothetical protein